MWSESESAIIDTDECKLEDQFNAGPLVFMFISKIFLEVWKYRYYTVLVVIEIFCIVFCIVLVLILFFILPDNICGKNK